MQACSRLLLIVIIVLTGLLTDRTTVFGRLVSVIAIWRHGDRAPGSLPYPKDRFDESYWPRGWDQLTNIGMEQAYELGEWIRVRYDGFISADFNLKEVFMQASDSERSLETGAAVAAALFPPRNGSVWRRGLAWQPTPMHSSGLGRDDALLRPTSVACAAYDRVAAAENDALYKSIDEDNGQLFRNLSTLTGMQVNTSNIDDLYGITKEIIHGLGPQPAWVTDELLAQILELKRAIRVSFFNSPRKAYYRGGVLLGDWITKLQAASEADKKGDTKAFHKAVLYSSHDGTVSGLQYAMHVGNELLVPYVACYIVELHHKEDNADDYVVQLWYRNGTLNRLTVPGCAEDCPLAQFAELLKNQTIASVDELHEKCKETDSAPSIVNSALSSIVFLLFIRPFIIA